jgi:hypothetical protein
MDEAHCLARAETFHIDRVVVAGLLNITTQRAEEIFTTRLATSGSGQVVLKASSAFMAGRRLSEEEVNYNRKAGGLPQTFYINQVIAMIQNDSVNWEDERVSSSLKRLFKLLDEALKPVKV